MTGNAMPTLKESVLEVLARFPGRTDRELTELINGRRQAQQAVNQACRQMAVPMAVAKGLRETTAEGRDAVERIAMEAVLAAERALGHEPRDVSSERLGYDIESLENGAGRLRFIEVKGRADGADTVTITRNEILTALNKPEAFILAIVEVSNGFASEPRYVRQPFQREPDFGATSVVYKLADLLKCAEAPV